MLHVFEVVNVCKCLCIKSNKMLGRGSWVPRLQTHRLRHGGRCRPHMDGIERGLLLMAHPPISHWR